MFIILKIWSKPIITKTQDVIKYANMSNLYTIKQMTPLITPTSTNILQIVRNKSKGGSKVPQTQVTESDEEGSGQDDTFDDIQDRNSKLMKIKIPSLRVDGILKTALGISRNKIDVMFYENRMRVNGEKLLKKNSLVNEGDEVDLIKSVSPANPENLIVARVEILSVAEKPDALDVKVKRWKSLTVENYVGLNRWKD